MMMKLHNKLVLSLIGAVCALLLLPGAVVHGQFTCTIGGGSNEGSCITTEDDTNHHCVWCALSSTIATTTALMTPTMMKKNGGVGDFGVCVSEAQAETMEQTIPDLVRCDRYSGTDDATPPFADDDNTPAADDDNAPAMDDATPTPNTDDQGPSPPTPDDDDYWKCLLLKDVKACQAKEACTWCDTPVGFGVCMSGPSAEAAETSHWFTCQHPHQLSTTLSDPLDPSCALVSLQDPSPEACEAAVDADGTSCQFCNLQGVVQVCLNADQAAMGEQYGLVCGEEEDRTTGVPAAAAATTATTVTTSTTTAQSVSDPMDLSCVMVYLLQDPSRDACESAIDADGNACQFCILPGALSVCLNVDQTVALGNKLGFECGSGAAVVPATAVVVVPAPPVPQDPRDPSCALVYLQNPSQDACEAAVDANGNPCEFCTLQGAQLELCLNVDQAAIGEQYGLECGDDDDNNKTNHDDTRVNAPQDPMDPSCALVYLQDPSKDACEAAVDADGNACQFCNLQDAFELCLNADQAAMGEQFGLECGDDQSPFTASA